MKWKWGDKAICRACGEEIVYTDPYWEHTGGFTPRHIAEPSEPIISSKFEVVKLEITKLELKPTDILVVKFPEDTSYNDINFIRDEIAKILPAEVNGFFLRGDVQLYTISKDEAAN